MASLLQLVDRGRLTLIALLGVRATTRPARVRTATPRPKAQSL